VAERVQKVLANAGVGSRRQIEGWIKQGRIIVDGKPAQLGDRLSGNEKIFVDGRPLRLPTAKRQRQFFLAYHKPAGEITSRDDPEGRATIFDNIRPPPHGRWITVGRLDISTSGLLLLTTDGELSHRLMHPSYEISRAYAVRLYGALTSEQRLELLSGVMLDDGSARFDEISDEGGTGANTWYRVTLREGRNREVRRIFEAIGLRVSRLMRVGYGPVSLGRLRRGETRRLSNEELEGLYAAVGLKTTGGSA